MARIVWLRRPIDVRRVVLGRSLDEGSRRAFRAAAERLGLPVADDTAAAAEGDLWVAGVPARGWGEVGWQGVAWVRASEVPAALAVLARVPTPELAGVS
jgi:hypothetical protein